MKPTCAKEYGKIVDPSFDSLTAVVPVFFTCNVLGTRMAAECKRQGGLPSTGNNAATSVLRANYSRYSLELIRITNLCIEGGSYWGAKRVFGFACLCQEAVNSNTGAIVQDERLRCQLLGSENTAPGLELMLQVERTYQLAVQLHAILTLPQPAVITWARSVTFPRLLGHSMYDGVRIAQAAELLGLLRQAYPVLEYKPGIR
ncbi:hypothetical protein PWT90_09836 [Aphanocladium album]|nr:hypothetical protein PWT90_09836 [Aphanocladium album]